MSRRLPLLQHGPKSVFEVCPPRWILGHLSPTRVRFHRGAPCKLYPVAVGYHSEDKLVQGDQRPQVGECSQSEHTQCGNTLRSWVLVVDSTVSDHLPANRVPFVKGSSFRRSWAIVGTTLQDSARTTERKRRRLSNPANGSNKIVRKRYRPVNRAVY